MNVKNLIQCLQNKHMMRRIFFFDSSHFLIYMAVSSFRKKFKTEKIFCDNFFEVYKYTLLYTNDPIPEIYYWFMSMVSGLNWTEKSIIFDSVLRFGFGYPKLSNMCTKHNYMNYVCHSKGLFEPSRVLP